MRNLKSVLIITMVLLSNILVVFPIFFVDTAKALEEYTLLDTQDDGDTYEDVCSDGTYVYAACWYSGIRAYSFDGATFTLLDTHYVGSHIYRDVWGDGTYVYAACGDDGIRAYSFDGATFTLLDTQDDGGYYADVWGDGTYVYAACGSDGIRAYSFDGATFTLLGTQDDGDYYDGVHGDGTYVYAACGSDGIRAYSFDGATFTLLDTQDDGDLYLTVWDDGTYVYASCAASGIRAYSFDGATFTLLDTQDDGYCADIWGDGNYIHVAGWGGGVYAYTFDGATFTLLDTQDDGAIYRAVWSDGTYIYTACSDDGIRAYSFGNPPTQSGEVPTDSSTGIGLTPSLYVLCTDINNDIMNATWWSNSTWAETLSKAYIIEHNETYTTMWAEGMCKLDSGKILCLVKRGTQGDNTLTDICMQNSTDNGTSWGSLTLIKAHDATYGYCAKEIFIAPNGRLIFHYLEWGSRTHSYVCQMHSDDDGDTWVDDGRVSGTTTYYGHIGNAIILSDGYTIVVALSESVSTSYDNSEVIISTDNGTSWVRSSQVPRPGGEPSVYEPTVVELSNGNLVMYCRSPGNGYLWKTYSTNKGSTWSEAVNSGIIAPSAPAGLLRYSWSPSIILMAWDNDTTNRYPLKVAVSYDECETWHNESLLQDSSLGDAAYPRFMFGTTTDDNMIFVGAEIRTGTYSDTMGYRFPFSWLGPEIWTIFATNSSISSGTNITQTNSNFSSYSTTYYWSVNLTDGTYWCNETYHFTTWWNDDWSYFKTVTIDNSYIDATLTNFPMLVSIDDATGDKCNANGEDIRFLSPDGSTELYYEIEKWVDGSDRIVWVNVPTINSDSDAIFLMYYGNAGASDNQNPSGVWDNNFKAVHHLAGANAAACDDSTSNNNDITLEGGTPDYQEAGISGYAVQLVRASSEYLGMTDDASLDLVTGKCLEMWVKYGTWNNDEVMRPLDKWWDGSNRAYSIQTAKDAEGVTDVNFGIEEAAVRADNHTVYTTPLATGTWYYIVGSWQKDVDSGNLYVYVNTDRVTTEAMTVDSRANNEDVSLGCDTQLASPRNFFDGVMDEVRISDIARSEAWIKASYHAISQTAGFLTFGSEQEYNNPPTITSWNADTEPGATSGWDWDNNDLQVDWNVADADSDSLILLWTFSKGGTPDDPTTGSYNGRKTGITSGSYTMTNQDLNWVGGDWSNYRGTVNFKFRLHDGTDYSTTIETDSLTGGIDGTDPDTTIMDQPAASDGPDSIWGTASDTICYVDHVDMYIKNTTDSTYWTGSDWSTETWLSASANDSFDSASENWNYDSSGIIWGDKNYEIGANTNDESGRDDPFPAIDTFTITHLISPIAPIADFTFTPSNPSLGELVSFYDLSTDEDGRIVSWYWRLGDGTTATVQNPTNTYGEERYYTIFLMVTDDDGLIDTAIKTLRVGRGEDDEDDEYPHILLPPYILPPRDPKHIGFIVPEMYNLLRVTDLSGSDAEITVVFIDSGMTPRSYRGTDLSVIECLYHPDYASGLDMNGHGTFVSYEIAYILETKLPNARLISYRAFDRQGKSTSDIFLESLDEVKKLKPDIVSISAGAVGSPDDAYSQKIKELRNSGIIVICAVGNLGPRASTIMSPACSDYAIGVGASDPQWADDYAERQRSILDLLDDTICSWSSRGPVEEVYPKPDLASPGESIIGPWLDAEKVWSGTSFSSPLIVGGSAVVLANNKGLADLVRAIYFWDSSVVPDAFEDALKDGCYAKGNVNDWGKGIPVFTNVNNAFFWNLVILLLIPIILVIAIIAILVIVYLFHFRKIIKKRKQK